MLKHLKFHLNKTTHRIILKSYLAELMTAFTVRAKFNDLPEFISRDLSVVLTAQTDSEVSLTLCALISRYMCDR